jgi:hypothetical protein
VHQLAPVVQAARDADGHVHGVRAPDTDDPAAVAVVVGAEQRVGVAELAAGQRRGVALPGLREAIL